VDYAGVSNARFAHLINYLGEVVHVDFAGTEQLSKTNILSNSSAGKVHGDRLRNPGLASASNKEH
jgi:hypothetical protein